MSIEQMGAKQRAVKLPKEEREAIIKAYKEQARWNYFSNKKNEKLLISKLNECNGRDIIPGNNYGGCPDCKRYVLKFWLNVIKEWEK